MFLRNAERRNSRCQGISALVAFVLAAFILVAGVLVVVPAEHAAADAPDYGPDGYFSALKDTDGDGKVMPVIDKDNETPGQAGDGWSNTRGFRIGKQRGGGFSAATYQSAQVSSRYKTLGVGKIDSVDFQPGSRSDLTSATTSILEDEVLLWADDVVVTGFKFDVQTSTCLASASLGFCQNWFERVSGAPLYSKPAAASIGIGNSNYSVLETSLIRESKIEGVCTTAPSGCSSGNYSEQTDSLYSYRAFPLSSGDVGLYLGAIDLHSNCPSNVCANSASGTWLRSPHWTAQTRGSLLYYHGGLTHANAYSAPYGVRPAIRLNINRLILSAEYTNQSQQTNNDLRMTFVDELTSVVLSKTPFIEQDAGVGGQWVLKGLAGTSDLDVQSGLGWKLVDPDDTSGVVVASGRTNYDAAAKSDGNMVVPCETLTPDKDYVLSVWGQQDGSATAGWTNRATKPVTGVVRASGDGVCALDIRNPVSYGIELTGVTSGTLNAYRIGEYEETLFDQTGALKSVRLTTPGGLGTVLGAAAGSAGGSDVDADNPIGWVAANWLGYPTDPGTDDVTSAFSPYAGKLQLFAKALAAKNDAELGGVKGSLPKLEGGPTTLPVSDEGLYLIVDSSGTSLPMIVGTKVFNDAVGSDGEFVDFVDAGVRGKPRLGQAALKSTVLDVAKRILNDDGMDGFDVGSGVEFEVVLRVPDLSDAGYASVSYAAYEFGVSDVAEAGLTLPAASAVRAYVDVPSPDTEVTGTAGVSVGVSGQTLTVDGLKAVFAESDDASGVRNKASVPAGSLIRVRYRAVLNAGASYSLPGGGGLDANENTVTLTRSMSNGSPETRSATANVYSFEVDLVKVDKDEVSKRLGGVQFEVSRDGRVLKFVKLSDGVYRLDAAGGTAVATHADGTLSLLGVEARELAFKETVAPSGYFKVSDFGVDVRPVWDVDATQVTKVSYATTGTNLAYVSQDGKQVVVLDPAWSLANLPYTGGIGILVLLILGGLILAFAVRPYILSHRAEATANILI